MEKCKLMTPLFYRDMFNREGRKMRAVLEREISNGAETYRIWRRAGKAQVTYPQAENDKYLLYVELNGYLAPLRMTDHNLIDNCGFPAAAEKLYGGTENRRQHFDALRASGGDDAVSAALSEERKEIICCGSDPARQADYIQKMLAEHEKTYLEAKENGGITFPDFIGALLENDLAKCVEFSAVYKEKCLQKRAERTARTAEENRMYCEERNSEAQQAVSNAVQILLNGGVLENKPVTFYRSRYDSSTYSMVNYLMQMYKIDVPLRTRGWISGRLTSTTINNGRCTATRFLRSKNGRGSQIFFDYMDELIHAAEARAKEETAACA